jgi:cation transport regulator ChaC
VIDALEKMKNLDKQNSASPAEPEKDLSGYATWLFGYGSLIWKPEIPYIKAHPAKISGFVRRFWQGSEDHRGTPRAPGRVVTLVPEAHSQCCGIAYLVSDKEINKTFARLDHREKNGYKRLNIEVILEPEQASERISMEGNVINGITYIADEQNEAFLGNASTDEIAQQIFQSVGPSGSNIEYLLNLAEALRRLNIADPHVFELEKSVTLLTSET